MKKTTGEGNRYLPHTKPTWNLELPDGYSNSLVAKDGTNHDDGYNFDERDDELEADIEQPTGWDEIAKNS
ncbi:hypothetical protein IJM16_04705 [Candidatus Saccharibacteria bacterium]|nr:hypothetical protein [Candidatus Saccharibacteria bacterium]